ncbi:MAG TPA: homogentisate 1,2-dioxygenase [Myxococcaceae bacterium]|nr:homogentisate 1,2-dioxygenase [Myxococcaceae bacterium]
MFERRVVGKVPRKHHIQLRDEKGTLMYEECITRDGFEGPYTIAYHQREPHTQSLAQVGHGWKLPEAISAKRPLAKRHYKTQELAPVAGAPVDARVPLLFNADVTLSVLHPTAEDPVYFNNADADDLFYIHEGSGLLRSPLGDLRFEAQDYVFIPRGMVHRFLPDKGVKQYWLSIELKGGLHLPRQWRNEVGQLRMDAPYSHRDFRGVEFAEPRDEGIRDLVVKRGDEFHGFRYQHSPLDVVGWDGTVYPWVFPILNFQPRAGLVHLPPTWHGTFAARGALVCSFVPRVVDFHPEAIPCPYPHSSVDCDEFLFYCKGNFTSRRGVGPGSVSHHPMGVAHGPHPGAYEKSIGHKTTDELAVMLDTTLPLHPTAAALTVEDPNYQNSFIP